MIGTYADAVSAVLGLLGALALAKAPMESLKSRMAILDIIQLAPGEDGPGFIRARDTLIHDAKDLLESERRWNLRGAILLCLSFGVLVVHYLYIFIFHVPPGAG
jgi:hypothetical protein